MNAHTIFRGLRDFFNAHFSLRIGLISFRVFLLNPLLCSPNVKIKRNLSISMPDL